MLTVIRGACLSSTGIVSHSVYIIYLFYFQQSNYNNIIITFANLMHGTSSCSNWFAVDDILPYINTFHV